MTILFGRRSCFTLLASLLLAGLLAACSSNPYAIKPNPVPDVKPVIKVNKLWRHWAGKGLDGHLGIRLRPAVAKKEVLSVDARGRMDAFSLKNGKRRWRIKTGSPISAGLYAGFGKILFGTIDGKAVALSAKDGHVLWKQQLSSEVLSMPASNGNRAVFKTVDGQITALDMKTGKPVWHYSVTVPRLVIRRGSTPLIDQGVVYAGLDSGKVVALDMSDGSLVWGQQVAIPHGKSELDRMVDIDNNLIINQGGLFASSYQGQVAVMDAKQGQLFWAQDISTYTPMSQWSGHLFIATAHGNIVAVDQQTGHFDWTQKALHGRHLIGTVVQSGYVVTGDSEGWLYWLDPSNGHLLARYHAAGGFAGIPVVEDNTLYALSADGKLSAYRVTKKR